MFDEILNKLKQADKKILVIAAIIVVVIVIMLAPKGKPAASTGSA